jgi:hypothetical protein
MTAIEYPQKPQMKIAKVGTTALSAAQRAPRSQQINDLRKTKSRGRVRIGEVRLGIDLPLADIYADIEFD